MTAQLRRATRRLTGAVMSAAVLGMTAGAAPSSAAWTVPSGSVLPNTSGMAGVTCVTASTCLLVGVQSGLASSSLAATWDGSSFTAVTPVSTSSELYGTDCGPTLCMAVGTDHATSTPAPHAESWNGSSWSSVTAATPSGSTFAQTLKVSCPSASFCAAVGWYDNGSIPLPFIEHWTGTSFSLQTLTLPGNTVGAKLIGVSCASASACKAVGYIEVTGQPRKTLVATWNGSSWAVETSANPTAVLAELHGVSCPSANACEAVGHYIDGSSVQHGLAEVWDGSTWDLQTVPDPGGGATDPTLNAVSCVSSTDCEAVGGYTSSTPHATPVAAAWNGSAWGLQSVPNPHGAADSTLLDVSCTTTCMAVGYALYDGSTGITGPRPTVVFGP
jgi:hypothetical protein